MKGGYTMKTRFKSKEVWIEYTMHKIHSTETLREGHLIMWWSPVTGNRVIGVIYGISLAGVMVKVLQPCNAERIQILSHSSVSGSCYRLS
jgi:hypothetical protein